MSTRILRIICSVLLLPAMMACSLFSRSVAPSQEEIEKEEQAVYSFFVGDGRAPVLILENTATDISQTDPQQTIDYIKDGLPSLSKETLDHFMERNKESGPLSPDMDLGVEYILLTPEELSEVTRQPNWHEVMAERYNGSAGYTAFSRVGFNRSLDQAVVYVGQMAGPLMGAGFYYLLEKEFGQWKLKEEIMVWIS